MLARIRATGSTAVAGDCRWPGSSLSARPSLVRKTFFGPTTITAYFTTATAIYPGDDVRVAGVKVGTIASIQPQGTQAKMTLHVDRDVPIPADAKAVIVAQNLVAARYVQLTPAYRSSGPTMRDGAVIPSRPHRGARRMGRGQRPIDAAGNRIGPQQRGIDPVGGAVHRQRRQRAGTATATNCGRRWLNCPGSGGSSPTAAATSSTSSRTCRHSSPRLRDSNVQIVQFENRFATLTSVLDDNRSDLDAALTDLSGAVGEVQRFIAGSRDQTAEQIQRLADVTQNLVDHQMALENVLHVRPERDRQRLQQLQPRHRERPSAGSDSRTSTNPESAASFCGAIGAHRKHHRARDRANCARLYLGPALKVFNPCCTQLQLPRRSRSTRSWHQSIDSEQRHLHRDRAGARRGGPEARTARNTARGVGVHRAAGRRSGWRRRRRRRRGGYPERRMPEPPPPTHRPWPTSAGGPGARAASMLLAG